MLVGVWVGTSQLHYNFLAYVEQDSKRGLKSLISRGDIHLKFMGQKKPMSRPRFELRTFCVLDRCDNQLRHRPIPYIYICFMSVAARPRMSDRWGTSSWG